MRKPIKPEPAVNQVDEHIGRRVRSRRKIARLSQSQLADELGLTFQQVQKYERGTNRISASKLFAIAKVLEVPVSYFFDGLVDMGPAKSNIAGADTIRLLDQVMADDAAVQMLESYLSIRSRTVRRQLANLAASLVQADNEDEAAPRVDPTQH